MKRQSMDEKVAESLVKKGQVPERKGGLPIQRDETVDIIISTDGSVYIKTSKGQVRVVPNSVIAEIEGITNGVNVLQLINDYEEMHTESNEEGTHPAE